MQIEAIFENIAEYILLEISKAQKSIFIAVAWFTNKRIFNALVDKANAGCTVNLIISNNEINLSSLIDFETLNIHKSRVFKVGNDNTELMHNKFCVIDFNVVITGSYNWSYKAKDNFENIVITKENTALAEQFIKEFNKIRQLYYPEELNEEIIFPLNKIIRRLEILKNYILLEDIAELNNEVNKLKEYDFNTDIFIIIANLEKKEYALCITKIDAFISANQQLSIWTDPEINALNFEIKILENQLNAYDNEKIELEKLLSDFQRKHTIELGELILEILKLRKFRFKTDDIKYQEAKEDEEKYYQHVNSEKIKKVFHLTDEELIELKKKFRKASVLCHPDKVSDEFKNDAQDIFVELKKAYDANNLGKVNEILENLENGNFFKSKSESGLEKQSLKAEVAKLRERIRNIGLDILAIRESDTFKTINEIENWNEYFENMKQSLKRQLQDLRGGLTI